MWRTIIWICWISFQWLNGTVALIKVSTKSMFNSQNPNHKTNAPYPNLISIIWLLFIISLIHIYLIFIQYF